MANVIKRPLNKKISDDAWEQFFNSIKKIDSSRELKEIVAVLFSDAEKIMVEKRLAIVCLLKEGKSYKEVGRLIDVSSATISFVKQGFRRNKNFLPKHIVYQGEGDLFDFLKQCVKEEGANKGQQILKRYGHSSKKKQNINKKE